MNQITQHQNNSQLPATSVGFSSGNGTTLAPQNLAEIMRFAEVMAQADIALPQHLRKNPGACMAVAMQALEWQMSPFAVASKSYAVRGIIAYEAQLIAAVVNTRSGIKGRLKYDFTGTGDDLTCRVSGSIDGEECEYVSPRIGSITTKNSPLWKTDPQQQLGYFSARSWARRHVPEVLLGVYDRDEAEQFQGADNAKNVTPSVMQRLQQRQEPAQRQEGFNADFVTRETETLVSGDISPSPADASPSDAGAEGGEQSPSATTLDNSSAVDHLIDQDKVSLRELITRLKSAVGDDPGIITATAHSFNAAGFALSDFAKAKARTITKHFISACTGELEAADAIALACGIAQIDESEVQP